MSSDVDNTGLAVLSLWPGVKLLDWQFVRWETIETPDPDAWPENELFQEAFGFRPNGPNATDTQKHGIYAKDLNGDSLDRFSERDAEEIALVMEDWS